MTAIGLKEMADLIGKTVRVRVEGFIVPMTISDIKVSYGNKRYLVSPIGGSGEAWVDSSRVTLTSAGGAGVAPQPVSPTQRVRKVSGAAEPATESGKIRAWAKARGIHVNERGRIPEPILREYVKAQDDDKSSGTQPQEPTNMEEAVVPNSGP